MDEREIHAIRSEIGILRAQNRTILAELLIMNKRLRVLLPEYNHANDEIFLEEMRKG